VGEDLIEPGPVGRDDEVAPEAKLGRVEQLARDAKVFQIYAGTDEIQVSQIARDLLSR